MALLGLTWFAGTAQGAGYALYEHSASALGNAFAGQAVAARDASTIFANPAGLARLAGSQVVAGVHPIASSIRFTDAAGTGSGGDAGDITAIPSLYYATDLTPAVKVGVGVFGPFGLKTEYDTPWAGSANAVLSHMKTINVNPTVAWRVNERLALGLGIDYQTIEAKLTKTGAAMEGEDEAWGYNLGLLYEVDEATRVGLSYRAKVAYRLQGLLNGALPVYADATMPDMASLAVERRLDERWTLLADLTWTGWSVFDKLDVQLAANGAVVDHTDESWEDAWRFGIGADYRYDDAWTWRFGIAYDQTPVPDDGHRTARIPDSDRLSVAVGGQYRLSGQTRLDFGYMHIFIEDSTIAAPSAPVGRYRGHADILGLQLSHSF